LFSFSQKTTFAMDSLIIDRESYSLRYGRANTLLAINSDETSKTIFIGILKNDSVHLTMKQGLIQYKSMNVPVLIYKFIFRDITNKMYDSLEGFYTQFPQNNQSSWLGILENIGTVYIQIKADADNPNLLAGKARFGNQKFDITHRMEKVKIERKSFSSTVPVFSKDIENNKPTETVKICTYKKTDISYNISVHTVNTFPEFKIICINSDLEQANNYRSHVNTYLMKGKQAESDLNSYSTFFIAPGNPKKPFTIRFKPTYTIILKN